MQENDARRLEHHTLEALRERAVRKVEEGESPEVVARVLGLNRMVGAEIKALAQREKDEVHFGDAAHIRSDHHAGRTWGQTRRNAGPSKQPEPATA